VDRQLRDEYAALGQWGTRSEELQFIESILDETSNKGSITAALSDFYESLSKLTTDPDNTEIRTNLQQNGIKLCETLNYYSEQLTDLQNSYNDAMSATVDRINDITSSIASYNEQIQSFELNGQQANELRDKRNTLVDELSQLVNISYSEDAEGALKISVGDVTLVNKTDVTRLTAVADQIGKVSGEPDFYSIYLEGTDTEFDYSSGKLKAYEVLRDGDTTDNMGIPYLLSSLNTLAQGLAQEFNAVHKTGYTIPYGGGTSQTGVNQFDVPEAVDGDGNTYENYAAITAGNISLSDKVLENVCNIAASGKAVILSAPDSQVGNNEVALELYALTSSTTLGTVGSFENYVKSFVVQVGIASAGAQETSESQSSIVDNLETRKESISGVSIDEEVINLISYQYAYAAASRSLTAIDEALDVLINRTGRVGL
jgi:flagellar hook-associated protein 1 FlgK